MAVQFILGRSGTGKTSGCVRAIADALLEDSEQPLLFLVPEQATYQAEWAILSDPRIEGYHRLHILSFERLQFLLLGRDTARPSISKIGRQMVVHKILRDNLDKLRIFGDSALLPGFAREMAATITELHQYARSPEEIERLVQYLEGGSAGEGNGRDAARTGTGGNRLSALKFADVGLAFRRYSEVLQEKFIDPNTQILSACRAVSRSDVIQGARLWVDGFASFTGGEMALLIEMLRTVEDAYVALCVDPAVCEAVDVGAGPRAHPSWPGQSKGAAPAHASSPRPVLFEPTVRTYRDMLERLAEARVEVVPPKTLGGTPRFDGCPALAHVERNLFRLGAGKAHAESDIRLIAAPSLRVEIQHVARQILSLVREHGYRYRDIAVVASDLGHYEQYVRAYFEDYQIPFFIDKRKPLNEHPVVELVCTALEAVMGGLAHADVFAWLKTDLVPLDNAEIAALENYCLAFGVDGRDWASDERWRFKQSRDEDFDEERINRIRDEAVGPLLELRGALSPAGDLEKRLTAGEFTRVIFSFLDRLQVRRTMSEWIDEAHGAGDLAVADEHRQSFDAFVDIFDSLAEIFDREEMTVQDYFGLLTSAFSQMTLAFIPPSLDQVLVGSIERSRHPSVKAIFLLGATQRQFPVPVATSGVLSDEDRDAAEAAEFQMAPSTTESLTDRQYLAYIAFTRPSKFMCVSYPCVDEKGSPIMRSHFIEELQSLFEDLSEEFVDDGLRTVDEVQSPPELEELLCSRLGRDVFLPVAGSDDGLVGLLRTMQTDGEYRTVAGRIMASLEYANQASLDARVAAELFGTRSRASATRLSTYAACPYKHFGRYILELKPRREFKLEPLDLGLFYHQVLDALHKRLVAEKEDYARIESERLAELLHEEIGKLAEGEGFLSQFVRRSVHNAFIVDGACRMLEECVLGIAQMVRAGSFRPYKSELGFGHAPDASESLGPFELAMPNGQVLSFDGKIDRLDLAEIDGRKVALILDYKRTRSGASFDWCKFYHGLDVQLAIYMLAVQQGALADDIAGALYMPIETTPQSATLAELAEDEPARFAYKAKGIINGAYCPHLDANASGYSDFYNFYVKKDGDPFGQYARSNALTREHFARLLDWAKENLLHLGTEIASGRIECKPYHRGSERACTNCEYMAVCRFDWQINEYNFLRAVDKTDLTARIESE